MSDRALITFTDDGKSYSPCIYLHWGGQGAPGEIRNAQKFMRKGDAGYAAARFCGECHKARPNTVLSLGLLDAPPANATPEQLAEYSHGDAGLYVVNVTTGNVTCHGGYGKGFKLPDTGWGGE